MQLVYLAAFAAGLAIGVYVMIRGVERISRRGDSPELDSLGRTVGTARMALTAPIVSAFATVFGITGYLLWRYSGLSSGLQLVGAAVAGRTVGTAGADCLTGESSDPAGRVASMRQGARSPMGKRNTRPRASTDT